MGSTLQPRRSRHNGLTSLLAMLYLMLIAVLAVGFYAETDTAAEVAMNDTRTTHARFAAESGLSFMHYQLANTKIPASTPYKNLFSALYIQLGNQINNTANLPSGVTTISLSADGNTIYIPSQSTYIATDKNGGSFRAEILKENDGEVVECTVYGRYTTASGSINRAIVLKFANHSSPSTIFNYGVATQGTIALSSTAHITSGTADKGLADVLATNSAANPVSMSGSPYIDGQVSMTSTGTISGSGGTIQGKARVNWTSSGVVKLGVAAPVFPAVETSVYEDYLAAHSPTIISASPSGNTFSNIRIKAGANPSFPSGSKVTGVVLVETPNSITFAGNATLTGIVVVNNSAGGATALNSANKIQFSGSVTAHDPSYLTAANGYDQSVYGDLQKLGGATLLVPTFALQFSSSSNSLGGTIAASKLTMSSSSGGTVDGNVIILDNQPIVMSSSAGITIQSHGSGTLTGLRFGSNYSPLPNTYAELNN